MPTFTETLVPTVSLSGGGGGGDAAQWGPCPPGSLMEAQELGLDLRAPSAVLPATDECARGTPPGGCSSGGCGCAKCPSSDTGLYTPPAGATSKLRKTMSVPVKWTETRGDGSRYEYDPAGHCHSYTISARSRCSMFSRVA
jgi:hypothetical protein